MAELSNESLRALAEKIRSAYLETTVNAYEDAAANGLCAQGAWECAVDALRQLEITDLLKALPQSLTHSVDDQISSRVPSGSRR